jgi:hypothetical protein
MAYWITKGWFLYAGRNIVTAVRGLTDSQTRRYYANVKRTTPRKNGVDEMDLP